TRPRRGRPAGGAAAARGQPLARGPRPRQGRAWTRGPGLSRHGRQFRSATCGSTVGLASPSGPTTSVVSSLNHFSGLYVGLKSPRLTRYGVPAVTDVNRADIVPGRVGEAGTW